MEFLDSDREHMQFMQHGQKRMFDYSPDQHAEQRHLLRTYLNFDGVSHLYPTYDVDQSYR